MQKAANAVKERWQPPDEGWIKCNVDGAFYSESGQGATGAVLQNDAGSFEAGRAKWYSHCLDPLSMEALACRDGVALAADLGVQKLKIETDSQELVNLWKMGDNQRSCIAPIIREIRDRSAVFLAFSLVYANRSCNHVR